MTRSERKARSEQARIALLDLLPAGSTVYTVLCDVSRSGMSRKIKTLVIDRKNNDIRDISWAVADVLELRLDKNDKGVMVGGCGMDMGFHIVYSLSSVLFPDGFECLGEAACKSNDHFNGDRDYTPHHHKSGGYCLKHRWL